MGHKGKTLKTDLSFKKRKDRPLQTQVSHLWTPLSSAVRPSVCPSLPAGCPLAAEFRLTASPERSPRPLYRFLFPPPPPPPSSSSLQGAWTRLTGVRQHRQPLPRSSSATSSRRSSSRCATRPRSSCAPSWESVGSSWSWLTG